MYKKIIILILLNINICLGQSIISKSKLIIKHNDITLYLTSDTCTSVSKHKLSYKNFLKLSKNRNNNWFQDTYKGKYIKELYLRSGYDLGHLTPSHITSYDSKINHYSFSLFNQAPQLPKFNRGKWAQLEQNVEDTIAKYKKSSIIITGVIYNNDKKEYLYKSKIPIPIYYYKVLYINNKKYCWLGSNINNNIITIDIKNLNDILKMNKMYIRIK